MSESHKALSEFVLDGKTYFLDQQIDREKVELLLMCPGASGLVCYKAVSAVGALKPDSFRRGAYVGILKKALKVQDVAGADYNYKLQELNNAFDSSPKRLRFTVQFKVADGGTGQSIFLNGAEFNLHEVEDGQGTVTEFLRSQAIFSGHASALGQEMTKLKMETTRYKGACEEAAALKATSEEGLLKAVVKIVNEKKAKAKELVEEVAHLEAELKAEKAASGKLERTVAELRKKIATLENEAAARSLIGEAKGKGIDPGVPAKKRRLDAPIEESADSYPDFTTVAASPEKRKVLTRCLPSTQGGADVARTRSGSRKRPTTPGPPATATTPNRITALDLLLDSD